MLLNRGPPKQAENAIFEKPFRDKAIFDIKSPILLPHANTESPSNELLKLLTTPNVVRTATTSEATAAIITIDPKNDPNIANNCNFIKKKHFY